MSDMVEQVARAIYDAPNGIDGDQVADMFIEDDRITGASAAESCEQVLAVCRQAARAAIAAMREPTEAMHAAGNDEMDCMDAGNGHAFCEHIWRAMIDAAINSDPKPA